MRNAKLIYSNKLEIFLGVSLALHLAVLGYWPLSAEQSNSGGSRSVVMVLGSISGISASIPTEAVSDVPTEQVDPIPIQESFDIVPEILESNAMTQRDDTVTVVESQMIAPEIIQANAVIQHISALSVENSSIDMPQVTQPAATIQTTTPPSPRVKKVSKPKTKPKVQELVDTSTQPVTAKLAMTPSGTSSQSSQHSTQASQAQEQSIPGLEGSNTEEKDLALLSAMLHEQIVHQRRYPVMAKRQRREGIATVRFDLFPDGDLLAVNLVHSSGYRALDHAAIQAVKRVSPFRPAGNYLTHAREFNVNVVFKLR